MLDYIIIGQEKDDLLFFGAIEYMSGCSQHILPFVRNHHILPTYQDVALCTIYTSDIIEDDGSILLHEVLLELGPFDISSLIPILDVQIKWVSIPHCLLG